MELNIFIGPNELPYFSEPIFLEWDLNEIDGHIITYVSPVAIDYEGDLPVMSFGFSDDWATNTIAIK